MKIYNLDVNIVKGQCQNNTNYVALQTYLATANNLKTNALAIEIGEKLCEISSKKIQNDGVPFVWLGSSSGKGKTQMVFTLFSILRERRRFFYLLSNKTNEDSQDIYKTFFNISLLFSDCVKQDLLYLEGYSTSPGCQFLYSKRLFSFGFIILLIEKFQNNNIDENINNTEVYVKRATGDDVSACMKIHGLMDKRPIFVLDEFNIGHVGNDIYKYKIMRNLFRSIDVGLVLLGTDCHLDTLENSIGSQSRNSDVQRDWCYVYTDLPPTKPALQLTEKNAHIFKIIECSRPLFSKTLEQEIKDQNESFKADSLDNVLLKIFNKIVRSKSIFSTTNGILGQFMLFLNSSHAFNGKVEGFNQLSLVHSHFANISGVKNLTLDNKGCTTTYPSTEWRPQSVFPEPDKDILLFLILLGGKGWSAFCSEKFKIQPMGFTVISAYTKSKKSNNFDTNNTAEKTNSGMDLEAMSTAAICLASHCEGLSGCKLSGFLIDLVYELLCQDCDRSSFDLKGLDQFDSFLSTKIPYFSPPNVPWPNFLNGIEGASFGFLSRALKSDMIDIKTSIGLSGECKDYSSCLSIEVLKKLIIRVPIDTVFHLVFCRKIQDSYFTKSAKKNKTKKINEKPLTYTTFIESRPQTKDRKFAYYKVVVGMEPVIEQINGLPHQKEADVIVLFVICPQELCFK